jgi:hypothetical protein
MKEDLGLAAP